MANYHDMAILLTPVHLLVILLHSLPPTFSSFCRPPAFSSSCRSLGFSDSRILVLSSWILGFLDSCPLALWFLVSSSRTSVPHVILSHYQPQSCVLLCSRELSLILVLWYSIEATIIQCSAPDRLVVLEHKEIVMLHHCTPWPIRDMRLLVQCPAHIENPLQQREPQAPVWQRESLATARIPSESENPL